MRVGWWPHTRDADIASYRLRCAQIHQELDRRGIQSSFYEPGATLPDILVLSKRYDAATLDHVGQLCSARSRAGAADRTDTRAPRLLLDLCDNHFHFVADTGDVLSARAVRLQRCIDLVDHVVTASSALAEEVVRHHPDAAVTVIPDAAEAPTDTPRLNWLRHPGEQLALRQLAEWHTQHPEIPMQRRLVWFGNHGSPGVDGGMRDLGAVLAKLARFATNRAPSSLTIISNSRPDYDQLVQGSQLPTWYLPWSARTFSRALSMHGTAVIPVTLNAFTRCKTANRVLTAYLHGLNVVAGSVPSYEPFSACAVLDDWDLGLTDYLDDLPQRRLHLALGQAIATRNYSLDTMVDRWHACFASLSTMPKLAPVQVGNHT